jgi:hypothetical protein
MRPWLVSPGALWRTRMRIWWRALMRPSYLAVAQGHTWSGPGLGRGFDYAGDLVQHVVLPFPPLSSWHEWLVAWGLLVLRIMEWSYDSSRTKMKIRRMPIPIDLVGVSCSRNLHRCTPLGASCLRLRSQMRFGNAHPYFLSNRLISEGALWSSASCYHHVAWFLGPWCGQLEENVTETRICGLALVVRVFIVMWNWFGDLWLGAAAAKVWETAHEKFIVLPCRMKIQNLTLIGCVW